MKQKLLIVLLLAFSVSCTARINKAMSGFQGQHFSNAIATLGPPTQAFSDGSDGQVFVWVLDRTYVAPGQSRTTTSSTGNAQGQVTPAGQVSGAYGQQSTSQTTYTPAHIQGWLAYRMLWVDGDGTVYNWAWKGL